MTANFRNPMPGLPFTGASQTRQPDRHWETGNRTLACGTDPLKPLRPVPVVFRRHLASVTRHTAQVHASAAASADPWRFAESRKIRSLPARVHPLRRTDELWLSLTLSSQTWIGLPVNAAPWWVPYVAAYAAIVSTGQLILSWRNYWRSRPRLRVDAQPKYNDAQGNVARLTEQCYVTVSNRGASEVDILGFRLKGSFGHRNKFQGFDFKPEEIVQGEQLPYRMAGNQQRTWIIDLSGQISEFEKYKWRYDVAKKRFRVRVRTGTGEIVMSNRHRLFRYEIYAANRQARKDQGPKTESARQA